jgi:LacI family transcriptional regulator
LICSNDDIAIQALSYLRKQGISVPKEISVVGFDNQPVRTLEHRLTSLDFNAYGFMHRMLNFIARPPRPRGYYRHMPVEVEAIVMQRDTAGPPRERRFSSAAK